MTKGYWAGVMVFSLLLTVASGAYLTLAMKDKATLNVPLQKVPPVKKTVPDKIGNKPLTSATTIQEPLSGSTVATSTGTKSAKKIKKTTMRNILFTLYSSSAKKVHIIGDFNEWNRQPLKKKSKKVWTISQKLKPGTYEYLYVVNGKRTKDPNNKKVSPKGNSVLTVKPLPGS